MISNYSLSREDFSIYSKVLTTVYQLSVTRSMVGDLDPPPKPSTFFVGDAIANLLPKLTFRIQVLLKIQSISALLLYIYLQELNFFYLLIDMYYHLD
jgi:hypothetical protein